MLSCSSSARDPNETSRRLRVTERRAVWGANSSGSVKILVHHAVCRGWPEIYAFFKFELLGVIDTRMNAEDIEEAILRLPPHELAKFRAWFADFEAGRVKEPEGTASRLGRLAGSTFAGFRKRMREP